MKTPSELARERMLQGWGEPWFLANWKDVLMIHYAVPPAILQPYVPYELDTRNGLAYVTLVGFTLENMRPRRGGALSRLAFNPIATHDFLNVRTYVKHGAETGIYFLAEWLPNRLSVALGRPVFGLPYRLGETSYEHHAGTPIHGRVTDAAHPDCAVDWSADAVPTDAALTTAAAGSLTEWLMERYTAFTRWLGLKRAFRVWHPAWPHLPVEVKVHTTSLLGLLGDWFSHATLASAQWSPGFEDVWMGAPQMIFNPKKHQ